MMNQGLIKEKAASDQFLDGYKLHAEEPIEFEPKHDWSIFDKILVVGLTLGVVGVVAVGAGAFLLNRGFFSEQRIESETSNELASADANLAENVTLPNSNVFLDDVSLEQHDEINLREISRSLNPTEGAWHYRVIDSTNSKSMKSSLSNASNSTHLPITVRGYQAGPEFQISPTNSSSAFWAATSLTEGGSVVVWMDSQGGGEFNIYGQLYDAQEQPTGSKFKIGNSFGDVLSISVTNSMQGGFVVIWSEDSSKDSSAVIYGKRYSGEGKELGSQFQVTSDSRKTYTLSVIDSARGGFTVSYEGNDIQLYNQNFNVSNKPVGQAVLAGWSPGMRPFQSLIHTSDGRFMEVWYGYHNGVYGIFNQLYSSTGTAMRAVNLLVPSPSSLVIQLYHAATRLDGGGFVMIWTSWQLNVFSTIYGQRFNNKSQPVGLQFQVNSDDFGAAVPLSKLSVAPLSNNGFSVAWISKNKNNKNSTISSSKKFAVTSRYFNSSSPEGLEFQLMNSDIETTSGQLPIPLVISFNNAAVEVICSMGTNGLYARLSYPNQTLTLMKNSFEGQQGMSVPLTSDILQAVASVAANDTLLFTVRNVKFGYFVNINNPNKKIISFLQKDIREGNIYFILDGSRNKPYYEIQVSDGMMLTTPLSPANVTFMIPASPRDHHSQRFIGSISFYIIVGVSILGGCSSVALSSICCLAISGLALRGLKKNRKTVSFTGELELLLDSNGTTRRLSNESFLKKPTNFLIQSHDAEHDEDISPPSKCSDSYAKLISMCWEKRAKKRPITQKAQGELKASQFEKFSVTEQKVF